MSRDSLLFIITCMKALSKNEIIEILTPERGKQIALAISIVRDRQTAEDLYQDMTLKVIENIAIFDGPRHLKHWSWKVLKNQCYELIRRNKYKPVMLDASVLELVDNELEERSSMTDELRSKALSKCISRLTENAQNIVKLRYFEGLRGDEVAAQLGRKPDTVYKALQRIYDTLGSCIKRTLENEQEINP